MAKFYTYLFFSALFFSAFAQKESLISLQQHPKKNLISNLDFQKKKASKRITALSLPFFDDFYQNEIFPNPGLWQDNFVFINTTYPKEAVTVGVASFDGTDANGKPYNVNANPNVSLEADKLTSNPIDLDGLTSASNVFLSFYYLQSDFGERPVAPNDLLTVQFLDTTGNWNTVWQTSADTVLRMRQVFLKVDSVYLNPSFQFRFLAFGNVTGANDIWHVDYVKVDKDRDTVAEKNIKEMAYEFLPPSLLKNYYVMPYHQFDSTDLKDTISLFVRNSFINATTDIVDFYEANVVNPPSNIASFSGPSRDFGPLTRNEIKYPKFNIPTDIIGDTITIKVDYRFDVSAEAGEPAKVLANNAVSHSQVFSNFYAYDDGTPERGYWLGDESGYRMAVKYWMRKPDTLQAIKMQLFPVRADNALARFSVCVWKNFGLRSVYNPNDLIYRQPNLKLQDLISEFGVDTINGYYYAPLKPEFVLNGATFPLILSDTFAIGLIVDNPNSLTVGYDRNNNQSFFNYYVDVNSEKWTRSTFPGTMIINPVVGKGLPPYLTPVKETKSTRYDVKIYPNPARDQLFIEGITENSLVELFALNGSLVKQFQLTQSGFISVNELPTATFVIKITNLKTNQTGVAKFVKSE
ncbi:MAG TPA: T9SS type A sorting domain-containing protein [Chitinophagales bacterium]|nr:T9SS type A sorting domain-containing protein [Chitinophagales bacterium]